MSYRNLPTETISSYSYHDEHRSLRARTPFSSDHPNRKRNVFFLLTALLGWVLCLSLLVLLVACGIAFYATYLAPDQCSDIRPVESECLVKPSNARYNVTRLLSDEYNVEMHRTLRERALGVLIRNQLEGDDDGLIFIHGAKKSTGEVTGGANRQTPEFVYLTGVLNFMDMMTVIDLRTRDFVLFQPRYEKEKAIWEWPHLYTLEELKEKFGASEVHYTEDLELVMQRYNRTTMHVIREQQWPLEGKNATFVPDNVDNESLTAVLFSVRDVKSEHELEMMQYANAVSKMAHLRLMRNAAPTMNEYHLESLFRFDSMNCGLKKQAYDPIVGRGVNSAVLHYVKNEEPLRREPPRGEPSMELVLVDAGAEFRGYASDITRTFPSTGVFNKKQKEIYGIVYDAQAAALGLMRPGTAWSELEYIARRTILEGLKTADFFAEDAELDHLISNRMDRLFMPHGLGHLVGLNVHDTTVYPVTPLLQGMVVTCEPGIYFRDFVFDSLPKEKKMLLNMDKVSQFYDFGGIRIEDDVLITKDGFEYLANDIHLPKTVEQIEALMQQDCRTTSSSSSSSTSSSS